MNYFSLKSHSNLTAGMLRFLDFILVLFLGYAAYCFRFEQTSFSSWNRWVFNQAYLTGDYTAFVISGAVLNFIIFNISGVYEHLRGRSFGHLLKRLFTPWVILVLVLGLFAFLTKTGELYSRIWMMTWLLACLASFYIYRLVLILCFRFLRSKGFNTRHILIIGSGALLEKTITSIKKHPSMGYVITEIINTDLNSIPSQLDLYLQKMRADEIWIALPLKEEILIRDVIHQLRFSTITIHLVPDLLGLTLLRQDAFELSGLPVLRLRTSPMTGMNQVLKYFEDKILGVLIFILLSPLMLLIMLGIKLSSEGPVIFKQKRYGLDNQEITVYKFRTMYLHQEKNQKITQAQKDDPRITKFGKFLRKTSLDELPQFFNVLQGRMSIVGPRPHAVAHNEMYKELINSYMLRHLVKPGITGWAQVNGFRGETDTLEKMKNRVDYDLFYIEHWSLGFDLKIIFLTLYKGFINKNAY